MVDAAVGSKSVFGRAVETSFGLPRGSAALKFFDFDSLDISRNSKENASTAITGFGGKKRGTPGELAYNKALKYDLTVLRFLMDAVAMFGSASAISDLTGAWLVKIRPGRSANVLRALSMYLHEGGSYSAQLQHGRRTNELTLTDAANKRVGVTPAYTSPTGDTVSGFPLASTGNAGTQNTALLATRGRRPGDSAFLANDSIYLKVISATTTTVTFKAAYDAKSTLQNGTDFPTVSYGSHTFTVTVGEWARIIDSNDALAGPIGLFGENSEPMELTIGAQTGGDMSALFEADDEFEFTASLAALTKSVVAENRLSTFHMTNAIDGTSTLVDSQTTKIMRPYSEYFSNSRRFPTAVDPTGDLGATVTFKKRLFDRLFRNYQDRLTLFPMLQSYLTGNPLIAGKYEGIEIFYPAMQVTTLKSGDIPNKNTLDESVTLEAMQPEATPSLPSGATTTFDATVDYPLQINVVCAIDPTPYIGAAV
jgi:hypothetical protein